MSLVEEKQQQNKSGSKSTTTASLAALGSVLVASSCCLPLVPFLVAGGAAGASAFFAPAGRLGVAGCIWFLQILAGKTMQLPARQDQHFSFVVLSDCGVGIHLLPPGGRQPGGRSPGR